MLLDAVARSVTPAASLGLHLTVGRFVGAGDSAGSGTTACTIARRPATRVAGRSMPAREVINRVMPERELPRWTRRAARTLALLAVIALSASAGGLIAAQIVHRMPEKAVILQALPAPYPYNMASVLETEAARPRDSDGILMVEYPSGTHYNPVTISQSAIAHYDRWLALGSSADRDLVIKDADWLVGHQAGDGLWYYDFPNGTMPVPWVSAMAQGQAISVLVRAYALTSSDRFVSAARRALATYDKPSGQGGVNSTDGDFVFYEETMPPYSPRILNGMVFAMYGALDMARVLGDVKAQQIFDAGVATLAHDIARYDAGNWSYYNQATPPGLASRFYHGLHIQLLDELWHITGDEVFQTYAARFRSYQAAPPEGIK